ncbi:MAG TPA: hypothetical protein P5081_15730 [Phycisphaerae bacterium]|nr:hypothetical protein [Phycisphaerae bacterium]HRW54321.1 hypothetical protein [Phycisphaerae bacterium]
MAIQFHCENCRQPIEVDDEAANQQAACPYCQSVVTVPAESSLGGASGPVLAQPTTSLQTALPLPHRQGAPASLRRETATNEAAGPASATFGFMAFATIIVSVVVFIGVYFVLFASVLSKVSPDGQINQQEWIDATQGVLQEKPWLGIGLIFSQFLGLTSIGLATASLFRRERPRWPAITVICVVGGFFLLVLFSVLVGSGLGVV